jgi:hypothetical protein
MIYNQIPLIEIEQRPFFQKLSKSVQERVRRLNPEGRHEGEVIRGLYRKDQEKFFTGRRNGRRGVHDRKNHLA